MSRYDIEKFDPPPDPDLVCCICQCVLDKAVECPCRHVFCQICIERWLSNRHTCPTCRKRTRKTDLKPVLPLVQNMLNRLMMVCDFRQNGCIDKVMLENFERHVKNCGYEMKTCRFSKCGQPILRMYIEKHEGEDCPHREIICNGDCGLMIPLSEMSVHNCVSALKAHIEEKNRMIEQLKVKLHELNNLSQSLNDQLVELRLQLSDRNRLFSEDMSDISDSDSSDYMSDELIQDSEFHESWFDSAASNGSIDNTNSASNEASNNDNVTNNVVDPENNVANGNGGSDVVQQVERTVVSSLFELSSRLERVRNQMRAVLNSGLISIQDANTLNEEVRIPSAALDAIVHNSNNSGGNSNSENMDLDGARNNENNNNNDDDDDDGHIDNDEDDDGDHNNNDVSDSDLSIHSRYSYGDSNDANATDGSENTRDSNANNRHQWQYFPPGESVSGDWLVTDSTNMSALTSVSPQSARSHSDENTDDNDDNNGDNDSESDASGGSQEKQSTTHIILSQPPDSPSDSCSSSSSFSSIPSTCSVKESHDGSNHDDNDDDDDDDNSNHHGVSNSSSSSSSSTPRGSYQDSKSSVFSGCNPTLEKILKLFANEDSSSHLSSVPTNVDSDNQSKPTFYLPCASSPYQSTKKVSDWMDSGKEDDNFSSTSKTNRNDELSDLDYAAVEDTDANDNDKSDSEYSYIVSEEGSVRNDLDSSLNMKHSSGQEDDSFAVYNGKIDNESEPNAVDTECEEYHGWGLDGIPPWHEEEEQTDKLDNKQSEEISKCEPDSTLSPNVNQSQHGSTSIDNNSLIVISSSIDSSDSSDSESLKYLTKRCRQTPNHPNYGTSNTSCELTNTVKHEKIEPSTTNTVKHEKIEPSTFIGSQNVVQDVYSHNDNNVSMKPPCRRRKTDNDSGCNVEAKRSKSSTHSRSSIFSNSSDSGFVADGFMEDFVDNQKHGSRKWSSSEHQSYTESSRNSKSNSVSQNTNSASQYNTYTSHSSPSRHRSSRRETTQYHRRNRSNSNKRSTNQSSVNTDNNGQSLNVKIDLSLINYNGKLSSESVTSAVPTATVVHGSANISPLSSSTTTRRDTGHSKQHSNDNNKANSQSKGNSQCKGNSQSKGNSQNKGNSQKNDESSHHATYRTRSATNQKHDNQLTGRNTTSNNVSPVAVNSNNVSNRDFPNSWRDGTDSSSDNAYESGYINSGTDEDVDFESDSSYEVAVPKSTAALLEEYASDESDESWTVGME